MKRLSKSTKSVMAILLAAAFFFAAATTVHAENTSSASEKDCSQASPSSGILLADDWECINFI